MPKRTRKAAAAPKERLPFGFEWKSEEQRDLVKRAAEIVQKSQADYAREILIAQAKLDIADHDAGREPRASGGPVSAAGELGADLPPETAAAVEQIADYFAELLRKKLRT